MQTINRVAAIVTPRTPFFEWSRSVLGDEAAPCDPTQCRTAFLIPEAKSGDHALKSVYPGIFDEMLLSEVNAPELWPKDRGLRVFRKWFDVETIDMVFDTAKGDLHHDL